MEFLPGTDHVPGSHDVPSVVSQYLRGISNIRLARISEVRKMKSSNLHAHAHLRMPVLLESRSPSRMPVLPGARSLLCMTGEKTLSRCTENQCLPGWTPTSMIATGLKSSALFTFSAHQCIALYCPYTTSSDGKGMNRHGTSVVSNSLTLQRSQRWVHQLR